MKATNLQIVVSTWYDTVTPESAERGDYDSTGNDWRSYKFSPDELDEAVALFRAEFVGQFWESNSLECGEVLYAVDPELDYGSGDKDYDRLGISVHSDDTVITDEQKQLIARINEALANL